MTRHTLILALIDAGNPRSGGDVLASLVFRGGARIFVPVELG